MAIDSLRSSTFGAASPAGPRAVRQAAPPDQGDADPAAASPTPADAAAAPAVVAPPGLPAAKHFDPVIGIDVHHEIVPPVTAVPNPFVGFLFDPFDYIPFIGASVWVNGLPRAQAGTAGLCMPPHRPMVGPFAKPPGNECELFMGSTTVAVDGDAFGYLALPVLSCNDVGMPAPPRMKSPPVGSLVLPTSMVIAIPMGPPVLVGGPPTVSLMALGMRFATFGLGKAFGALKKTSLAKQVRARASEAVDGARARVTGGLRKRSPGVNKGCGRAGEPIDVVTGANVDEFLDFERPGAPPLRWTRYYDSRLADRPSLVGRGFRLDLQRELSRTSTGFTYVDGEGEPVDLPPLRHHADEVSHDGLRLRRRRGGIDGASDGEIHELEARDGVMRFAPHVGERPSPMIELRTPQTTWRIEHDEHGRPIRLEDATRRLGLRYDAQGLLCEVIDEADAEPEAAPLASYRHDARGRLVEHRDAHGHASTYAYDEADRMIRKTDRSGYAFHYRYDDEGRCIHSRGDDGMYEIRLAYDREGRETRVTWPDGGVWRYRHDEHGVLTEIVDPDGWSQRFLTDEHGVVRRHLDEAGNATTLLYDRDGRHVGRRDPRGYLAPPIDEHPALPDPLGYELPDTPLAWRWGGLLSPERPGTPAPRLAHDRLGRLREELDAHGAERWQHDAAGNVVGHRDRDGRITRLRYGSWNQLRELVDAEGGTTRVASDFRGNVTRIEDPGGAVHEYAYDLAGRLVEVRRDGAPMERYRWDRSGNLVEKLDGHGRALLSLRAGPGNLMKERRLASGEVQRFEHDAHGRIVRASTDALTVERAHDAHGRVIRDARDGQGVEHRLRGGRLVATRWFDRFEIRYEHERDGSLAITDPTGTRHRIESADDGTITRTLGDAAVERLWYDDRGVCVRSELRSNCEGTARPWIREYRSSAHGDLLAVHDSRHGSTSYRYDGLHRLVDARPGSGACERYRWDAAGNLLEQPGLWGVEVGSGNRLRAACGERLEHDERLRLCHRAGPRGATSYRYDSLDRLVAVERNGERWSAAYDPLCRRTSKTWRGRTTTYHWDDFRLGAERFADGTLRIYVYPDLESLVPMMFVECSSAAAEPSEGRAFFVLTDQVGAPTCVLDEAGHAVWRARMRPFGSIEVEPGSTIALGLRFPGHLHDPETGLHLNRFRYYDPALGRYLQPDPLGVAGGLDVYQYCPSPLSTVDLDGLICGAFGATVGRAGRRITGRMAQLGNQVAALLRRLRGAGGAAPAPATPPLGIDDIVHHRPIDITSYAPTPDTDTVVGSIHYVDDHGTLYLANSTAFDELYPPGAHARPALYTPMRDHALDDATRLGALRRIGPDDADVTCWYTPQQDGCAVMVLDWGGGQYSMAHLQPPTDEQVVARLAGVDGWTEAALWAELADEASRVALKESLLLADLRRLVVASQGAGPAPVRHIVVQSMASAADGQVIQLIGLPAEGGWSFFRKPVGAEVDDGTAAALPWTAGSP